MDGVATAGSTRHYVPRPGFQPILKASPVNLGGLRFTPTLEPEKQGRGGKAAKVKPAIVVQDQTNCQGAPPVTIKGNKVAYSSGSLQVGKTAVPLVPANKDQPAAPVEVQGTTFTPVAIPPKGANEGSANNQKNEARPVVLIKVQTLIENGRPATINGKPVMSSCGAVYADGTKVIVPTLQPG